MKRIAISFLFTLSAVILSAQSFGSIQFPVSSEEGDFAYPFAGGMQAPQFSQADLDFDGDLDLFVFDRSGDVISTYENNSNEYVYAPKLSESFPVLREWAYLKDYNDDGIADLFCSPSMQVFDGIEVWTGRNDNGKLTFDLKKFDQFVHDGLFFVFGVDMEFFNVYVPTDDFPVIDDVNNDGDLDVISFGTGGSQIWYYENQVIEQGLPKDTFAFILADDCYGGAFESEVSQDLFLSETFNGCAQGIKDYDENNKSGGIHAGSTLLNLDANNDGLYDLLIGDLANSNMTLAFNGGTTNNAWFIDQDIHFPEYNEVIEMPFFLGSFQIDFDFDGDQDLIATCNRKIGVQNVNNIWLYEKISNTDPQPYILVQKDFLVDGMIELGEFTAPTFIDVDQDGLMDIIVGTSGEYITNTISNTSMTYLKNVGTKIQPEFIVEDSDWLNFSDFKEFTIGPAPSFGDLDNDGDIDLIIGERTGKLYYYENTAGAGNPLEFAAPVAEYKNIDVGNYSKPLIVDLDEDGLSDLVIGEVSVNDDDPFYPVRRSCLNFFKNIGEIGNPDFSNDPENEGNTPFLGQVISSTPFQSKASCAPCLAKSNDESLLFVGSETGAIDVFGNVIGNIDDPFERIFDDLYNIHIGSKSTPCAFDIDNDGFLELLVGNERGGLNFFSTDILSMTSNTNETDTNLIVTLYPNPSTESVTISSNIDWDNMQLIDVAGRKVLDKPYSSQLEITDINPGIYFLKLSNVELESVTKLIKH